MSTGGSLGYLQIQLSKFIHGNGSSFETLSNIINLIMRRNPRKKNKKQNRSRGKFGTSTMSANQRPADPSNYTFGTTLRVRGPTPDSVLVDLFYQDTTLTRNNVGGLLSSWRYRINSAYDPDPLLGTGAISGFIEWSAFFLHYRVVEFGYDVQLANNESFPLLVLSSPTLVDVGANYSSMDQFSEFPYGRKNLISAKGGQDKMRFRGTIDVAKLEGTREALYDSGFSSNVNTNPAMLRFFNVGFTGGTNVLVNGVMVSIRLRFKTLFSARAVIPA
jgi:hypothetical protein